MREIARLREQVCEALGFGEAPPGSAEGLQRYFLAFAVAARTESRGT